MIRKINLWRTIKWILWLKLKKISQITIDCSQLKIRLTIKYNFISIEFKITYN